MKKKVAIVLHGLQTSGMEMLMARLSEFIDSDSVELTYLIAVDKDDKQLLEDEAASHGAKVIHLHDLDQGRILRWPFTLFRAFKKYGPFDAVHANMDLQCGLIVTVARLAGVPLRICHAHASDRFCSRRSFMKELYRSLMRSFIRHNANCRLACSENAAAFFFRRCNYAILPNGINLNVFDPDDSGRSDFSGEGSGLRIITVGRLAPEKNPFFLLDVFDALHQQCASASLTWVGTGKLEETLREKVHEKGLDNAVSFLGARNDVNLLLKNADCFLFPSFYEAFGLALLEAQAAGVDCFASDTIPEIVNCGKCRFLSINDSPQSWAEEILRYFASNTRMTLDRRKLEQFDIRNMGRKLTQLYVSGIFPNDDVEQ